MQKLAADPSGGFRLYGLYSLWDIMRRIQLQDYVKLGEEIRLAAVCADGSRSGQFTTSGLDGEVTLYIVLKQMEDLCRSLGARQTAKMLEERRPESDAGWEQVRPKSWEELDLLVNAFKRERNRVFLYMPTADAEFWQSKSLLTPKARAAFPKLSQELKAAGNAYACGLATAAVFHCMRALEHALAALAVDVGLTRQKEQWHNIIEQIEARVRDLNRTLPMGVAKDERINFLSQAAKEFMYFKDGWRNYVAHNRISYTQSDALEVIEHVQAFTEKLAVSLKE